MFFAEITEARRKRQERDMFLSTLADAIAALVALRKEAEMHSEVGLLAKWMANVVEDARAECIAIGVAFEDLPYGAGNVFERTHRRSINWHPSMAGARGDQVVLNLAKMPVGLMSVGSRKAPRVARAI